MEQQPHTEIPRFIGKEEREHVEFYKDWIRAALIEGLAGIDELLALRERFSLSQSEEQLFEYRGINLAPFRAVTDVIQAQIDKEIDEEVSCAVQDLRNNIFGAELFKVGIVVGEEVKLVEGIATKDEDVLPIVDGEPYEGGIDDVLFDR